MVFKIYLFSTLIAAVRSKMSVFQIPLFLSKIFIEMQHVKESTQINAQLHGIF